jgi:FkbM family methyltransferase
MSVFKKILRILKSIGKIHPQVNNFILKAYFRSIFYRKKHIRKGKFGWLNNIDIVILNKQEGKLKYKNLEFTLLKNDIKSIPLHQKYLYAALISYYNIPKYYILFWDDLVVFQEIFIDKIYDKIDVIQKGDTILDIGASIGWYTCKIADLVGENGRIIAIEPEVKNFYYLMKNVKDNNFKNVEFLNLGVWSFKKKASLISKKYTSSLNNSLKLRNIGESKSIINIQLDTIDNIIKNLNLEKIDLIKMDVEGAEVEAIQGAKTTLKKTNDLDLIIAAYHENPLGIESYRILIPYLEKLGFRIKKEYFPFIYASK